MTPALRDLALYPLVSVVLNIPALWGMSQLYFFQDGPPPNGEEEEDDVVEPPKTCDAEFVSDRRNRDWYRNNGFGEKLPCSETRKITIRGTKSIPIYWAVAGGQWTEAEVREKLDKARTWFARYCISLPIKEVPLPPDETGRLSTILAMADAESRAKYDATVRKAYHDLWNKRMKRPKLFLLLFFVDPFKEVVYNKRPVDVSGNFADIPVILITRADKTSAHIVTHELIHGVREDALRRWAMLFVAIHLFQW